MIKKLFYVSAVAVMLCFATSCNKETRTALSFGDSTVTLSISANSGDLTKAVGVAENATGTEKVNSIQAFVFRKDSGHEGELAAYVKNESGSSASVTLNATGDGVDYEFYVIANNYDQKSKAWKYNLASCTTKSELGAVMTELSSNFYLADGTSALVMDLLMAGATTKNITSATTSVNIEVGRLVAKVELQGITVSYSNEALKSKNLRLDAIYLIDAAKNCTIGGSPATTVTYYNEGNYVSGNANAILYDADGVTLLNTGSTSTANAYSTTHKFFTYGNASTKHTKLVIRCTYNNSEVTYYPVDIEEVKPGYAYIVTSANIKGLGTDDPEKPVNRDEFGINLTVKPWTEVLLGNGGTVNF